MVMREKVLRNEYHLTGVGRREILHLGQEHSRNLYHERPPNQNVFCTAEGSASSHLKMGVKLGSKCSHL